MYTIEQPRSVPHKDGNGRPRGEEPCDETTVQKLGKMLGLARRPSNSGNKCEGQERKNLEQLPEPGPNTKIQYRQLLTKHILASNHG